MRVSQLWRKFSLEVNIRSESEKVANFSLLEKKFVNCSRGHLLLLCQPWKMFSAIVPKTSKVFPKSSSFEDFLSEILLCKCSSGHVEKNFWPPWQKLYGKNTGFTCQSPKNDKPNLQDCFFCSSSSVHLDYCYDTPDAFFWQNLKKATQSPERDEKNINYFYQFSSKFCWGHTNCTLSIPAKKFLPKYGYFRSETEISWTLTLPSKKTFKRSALNVGCSFDKFANTITPKVQ